MVVRRAIGYALRRTCGMLAHPRRTTGELVSDVGQAVTAGIGVAGLVAGTVSRAGHPDRTSSAADPQSPLEDLVQHPVPAPEDLVERPGPVSEEVLEKATTPVPTPAPPKERLTARKVGEEVKTPSGITAAEPGHNPATGEDTDLVQPGTEPLMDPSLTKAVASEAKMMRKAAAVKK